MRIIEFFDGAQSETTPTIGNIVASGVSVYANDAAYEAAELGAPTLGNLYYNSTLNQVRYYNGSAWTSVVDETGIQIITNKTIDADNNTITNIGNDEIATNAAIDASKIHDGSVSNTEFGYLDGVTSNIQSQLNGFVSDSEKGAANGVATLDGSGVIPSAQLPSFVDDVEEYADQASLPASGESGKIYVTIDENKTWRWTGSTYVEIGNPAATPQENIALVNVEGIQWTPSSGGGAPTVTASQTSSFVNNGAIVPDAPYGFSFTPSTTGILTEATVRISPDFVNGDGNFTLYLYAFNGGNPELTPLDTSNAIPTSTFTVEGNVTVAFTGGVTITSGQEYLLAALNTDTGTMFFKLGSDEPNSTSYTSASFPPTAWSSGGGNQNTPYHEIVVQQSTAADLTLSEDIYLSVPPLPKEYNTIPAGTFNPANGQCLYVSIDRAATANTNLVVQLDDITNVIPDGDKIIFFRMEDDKPFIGIHDIKDLTESGSGSVQTLDDLSDVDLTTNAPQVGDILRYDGTNFVPFKEESVIVTNTSGQSFTGGAVTQIGAWNVVENSSNSWNNTLSEYVVPEDGNYDISVNYLLEPFSGISQLTLFVTKNGVEIRYKPLITQAVFANWGDNLCMLNEPLQQGDVIKFLLGNGAAGTTRSLSTVATHYTTARIKKVR